MIVAVVYLIHVRTPHQHIAKLFIKNVPKDFSGIKDLLDATGYKFGEFGIPWANHYIQKGIANAHPQVKGAWRRKDVETIDFQDLQVDWAKVDEEN